MKQLVIDGAAVESRAALHALLFKELTLPAYYGRNLDALYDCLTDPLPEKVEIRLRNFGALVGALGPYAHKFAAVLARIARENPNVTMEFEG